MANGQIKGARNAGKGARIGYMKRLMVIIITLLTLLIFSGCAARISNVMRSWKGHHYSDLIASWGPPQQVFDDGKGGRLLIWSSVRSWTLPGQTRTNTIGNATIYDNYIWG